MRLIADMAWLLLAALLLLGPALPAAAGMHPHGHPAQADAAADEAAAAPADADGHPGHTHHHAPDAGGAPDLRVQAAADACSGLQDGGEDGSCCGSLCHMAALTTLPDDPGMPSFGRATAAPAPDFAGLATSPARRPPRQ